MLGQLDLGHSDGAVRFAVHVQRCERSTNLDGDRDGVERIDPHDPTGDRVESMATMIADDEGEPLAVVHHLEQGRDCWVIDRCEGLAFFVQGVPCCRAAGTVTFQSPYRHRATIT